MKHLFILILLTVISCNSISKQDHSASNHLDKADSEFRYGQIKELVGDWYLEGGVRLGETVEQNLDDPFDTYSISSGGHSVIEKLFVGQPNEMVSVYYLDNGQLKMDHYCSLGNQPRMVAIPGNKERIDFEIIGISNLKDQDELHISSHALEFNENNELIAYWGATEDGIAFDGSMYRVRKNLP